jgi:hypothetical protein
VPSDWQGRAAEAAGKTIESKGFYERAALQPIAYYGQPFDSMVLPAASAARPCQ